MSRPVFFSIHDLMPQTMDAVRETLAEIEAIPAEQVLLLIVPGCEWQPTDLDTIRRWSDRGYPLAGHGWRHVAKAQKDWPHKLHSWMISRNVAEHLSCAPPEISQIINDCSRWFENQRLPQPSWYVPPAWAMGNISIDQLASLPFRYYEVLTGVIDSQARKFHRMPLMGYEADTLFRSGFLRTFNGVNRTLARLCHAPLRVSIHPYDFRFRQARSLRKFVARCANELQRGGSGFRSADAFQWLASPK